MILQETAFTAFKDLRNYTNSVSPRGLLAYFFSQTEIPHAVWQTIFETEEFQKRFSLQQSILVTLIGMPVVQGDSRHVRRSGRQASSS